MNPGGKRNQPRSSWWSVSSEGQNWLSTVRQRVTKKPSGAAKPGARFGIKQAKNRSL
jgi:hypothetical protein